MWIGSELDIKKGSPYLSGNPLQFSQKESAAVFIGHSTVLVHMDEQNFLTDPLYLKRLYILKRRHPPGVPFQDLPKLDFILISHGHLDHMDLKTLNLFPRSLPIVIPKRLKKYLTDLGFRDVRTLSWGEDTFIGFLNILALPAQHIPGRSLFETRSVPQSYLVQGTRTIFFCGDSGLTQEFQKIGMAYAVDLALLPIGSYRPAFFRRIHMNPEDALQAMEMLRARKSLPIHWGTFRLSLEPLDEPPGRFARLVNERKTNPQAMLWHPGEKILF